MWKKVTPASWFRGCASLISPLPLTLPLLLPLQVVVQRRHLPPLPSPPLLPLTLPLPLLLPLQVVVQRRRREFNRPFHLTDKDAHELWNSAQMECR